MNSWSITMAALVNYKLSTRTSSVTLFLNNPTLNRKFLAVGCHISANKSPASRTSFSGSLLIKNHHLKGAVFWLGISQALLGRAATDSSFMSSSACLSTASRVSPDHHLMSRITLLEQPLGCRCNILHGGGKRMLRRQPVIYYKHFSSRCLG